VATFRMTPCSIFFPRIAEGGKVNGLNIDLVRSEINDTTIGRHFSFLSQRLTKNKRFLVMGCRCYLSFPRKRESRVGKAAAVSPGPPAFAGATITRCEGRPHFEPGSQWLSLIRLYAFSSCGSTGNALILFPVAA
jgi:hypothetical protein